MDETPEKKTLTWPVRLGCAALLIATLCVVFVVGVELGAMRETDKFKRDQYTHQSNQLAKRLAGKAEYARITVNRASTGYAYLTGTVKTENHREQLRREAERIGGEDYARDAIISVEIEPTYPKPK